MKIKLTLLGALALTGAFLLTSCGGPGGMIYTDVMGNNYYQAGATTESGGKVVTGQSCYHVYAGVYAGGDASVAQALADAGVQNTSVLKNIVVDHKVFSILGVMYMEYCTVVTATVQGGGGASYSAPAPSEPAAADDSASEDSAF